MLGCQRRVMFGLGKLFYIYLLYSLLLLCSELQTRNSIAILSEDRFLLKSTDLKTKADLQSDVLPNLMQMDLEAIQTRV